MVSIPNSLVAASICCGLVLLLSVPHVLEFGQRYLSKKSQYEQVTGLYEDEDGTATEESQAAFSDQVQKLVLILGSSVATVVSAISAVLITIGDGELLTVIQHWIRFGTWFCIFFQAWTIFITPGSTQRFLLGTWSAFACLLLAIAIPIEDFPLWFSETQDSNDHLQVTFSGIQFLISVILCFTNVALPRRPDVYFNNKVVDRQFTASFLGRYTFTWPGSTLDLAVKNRGLTADDLPVIGSKLRASTLKAQWDAASRDGGSFFWRLVRCYRSAFTAQYVFATVTAVTNFLPQIILYLILQLLEARDSGSKNQLQLWLVAIGLGLAVGLAAWLESVLFYTVFLRLGTPVYEQMAAIIFAKAIRRKDVKGAADLGTEDDDEEKKDEDTKEQDSSSLAKTKQSTINLISVDGKRIADFACYNYMIIGSTIKVTTAIVFLVRLIGWIPTFTGLAVPFALAPLTYWIGKKYSNAQELLMKARDRKMAVVTEALQGIRQIKFSALEKDWYEKINQVRKKELKQLWVSFCYDGALISNWIFGPIFLSVVALTIYAFREGHLSASVAFTTLSVFEGLEMSLAVLPEVILEALDAKVSAKRVQEYLDSDEIVERTTAGNSISFANATVAWPSDQKDEEDETFKLYNVDIQFVKGELNVISGQTGSGKSLLLSSIIGEADIPSGVVTIPRPPPASLRFDSKANKSDWIVDGSIAYVSQIPWIENASLRDNILFGLPHDEERYKKVISVCALEKDLEMLADGDMTDIGANGINLSGGQKWRTSFARAVYSRASILVLDDIFSAVDAHVGRQLYEEALTGDLCRGRTRILVTHHVALCLPKTKYSVLLENGRVLQAGATEELRRTGLLKDILAHDIEEQKKEEEEAADIIDDGGHLLKTNTNQSGLSRHMSATSAQGRNLTKKTSRATEESGAKQREPFKKFTEDEKRETGAVKLTVYKEYIKACRGFGYWILVAFLFTSWVVVFLGRSYWISVWARQYDTESRSIPQLFAQHPMHSVHQLKGRFEMVDIDSKLIYLAGVYGLISLVAWFIGTVRYISLFISSIKGSRLLFERLTNTILRSPLRFLDQTPVGRILNRFTADFNALDSKISYSLGFMLSSLIQVLSVIIAGFFVSPFMIVVAIFMAVFVTYYAKYFLAGAREVKRLESNAKSPIFEQFGSVLTGISTIRAFDKTDAYQDRMFAKINKHCQAYWYMWVFNRWMGFRVNMVGAAFTAATAALVVGITRIDAPLAGFVLSFGLQMSESIIWTVRQYANVELEFNAVERILEYSNLETETDAGIEPPAAWPTKGEIEVDNLVAGYADDLPPVLRGLTFSVKQNERIGVVGRTGAGKSSLTLTLFRFLEARSGTIHIDGIDISKIKLYDLRSRLAIIPQDPVLFSGTVRSNLDPFNQHSDTELRDALARVHLISSSSTRNTSAAPSGTVTPNPDRDTSTPSSVIGNANVFKSLSSPISEGGLNLSQGQRQLLCLARAIVSRPKIMVLDEATSSVDMETDALIQQSIREEFQNSSLIVIAHRLSTIADFDRILVMGEGRVCEYDSPKNLMSKEKGENAVFRDMVEKSGERAVLEKLIFGADRNVIESSGESGDGGSSSR